MTGAGTPFKLRNAGLTAALVAGYVASATVGIGFGRGVEAIPSAGTASGFLVGALILLSGPWRLLAVALCLGFQGIASFVAGDGVARALISPLCVLLQAGLAGWLAVAYGGARARRISLRRLALLIVAAIAPAAFIGGAVGALLEAVFLGRPFAEDWAFWAITAGCGMAIVLPALLLIVRREQYREFSRSWFESVGLIAAVCGVALAVYIQNGLPLHFVIFPALMLVAFRLGPPGAAVAGLCVAAICLICAAEGHGPGMLVTGFGPAARLGLTEVILATAIFTSLAAADAVADQQRVRRLLVNHDRYVRAARRKSRAAAQLVAARAGVRRDDAKSRAGTPVH